MTTQTWTRSFLRSRPTRLTLGCWAFIAALGLLAGCAEEDTSPVIGDATETGDDEPMADTTGDEDEGEIEEIIPDLPEVDEIDQPDECVPLGELCSADDDCCEGTCQINEVGTWTCDVVPG